MKKIRIITLSVATLVGGMMAHGQSRDGSVMIDRENRPAVMITVNQSPKITGDALNQRLQRSGLQGRTRKGVTIYNRAMLSEISPDQLDIYTKVEKISNNSSIVYMAVSRGYNGFTNSPADSLVRVKMKSYLDSFVINADHYSADMGISNHIVAVNKEEKMYQLLLEEQNDLQKKKSDIESRLLEIQRELRVKEETITKRKSDLETARTKRNKSDSR